MLLQLLKFNGDRQPRVLFIDEDPAMEAAVAELLSDTYEAHCIWHLGSSNVPKNLRPVFLADFDAFHRRWWVVRNGDSI